MKVNYIPIYSWDVFKDVFEYTESEYPDIDIHCPKRKVRQRLYERIIIDIVLESLFEDIYTDPIDNLQGYEIIYEYYSSVFKNDIYKFQLAVVKKILMFLIRRDQNHGC